MLNKIRHQLTLWYSLGILSSILVLLVLFYTSTQIVFYRQVDDTLKTHLVALADNISSQAKEAGCNCVSEQSPFLEGILQIPGMPTAILDLDHQIIKSSVDWAAPEKSLTEFIPGSYFNDKLATLSYRFLMLPVISDGKSLGFVVMGHPVDAFLKTRTTLAGVMIVIYLLIIFPAIILGKFLAEKALFKQKQFITEMAHSLKTPLAVLQSQVEINTDQSGRQALLDNLEKISQTVNQALETAYDSAQEKNLPVNLKDLVRELIEISQHLGQKKGIKIISKLPSGSVLVNASKTKLAKALLSVLENAVIYGKRHGLVKVFLETVSGKAVLTIIDNGPGISEEEIPLVFNRFYRGTNAKTHGHGLGLTMTKNIIEELGGQIYLESKPGKGTTVIITLLTISSS